MKTRSPNRDVNKPKIMVVMGLLLGSLLLTVILAWQAQISATSHLRTAENVLREYALLVSDEFVRRSLAEIGFYGYFHLATLLKGESGGDWRDLRNASEQKTQRATPLAKQFFEYDSKSQVLSVEDNVSDTALDSHIKSIDLVSLSGDEPFHLSHYEISAGARSVILVNINEDGVWRGFELDLDALGSWFESAFGRDALLPPSLANGVIGNDAVFLSVRAPSGQKLFQAGNRYDPYLIVKKTVGDDYQGILQDFAVSASIDPQIASSLVIGGLPRSRLPILIGLMLLTVGLMITAIWLLRREQSLMKMRSDFVAQVSHELRTPLTQIRMFAETLLMNRIRNDDERRRSLEIINRESQRLTHLVDNVLQFSKESNGHRLNLTPQLLAPLIEEVTNEFSALNGKLNIKAELDQTLYAKVDADALRQILLNLLDNAVKYGADSEAVNVGLTSHGDNARLMLSDRGPGIPSGARKRVWQDFYRLTREQDNAIAGTGIGLSVVRELVLAHGGDCYVDPDYEHGTRIVIELPLIKRRIVHGT